MARREGRSLALVLVLLAVLVLAGCGEMNQKVRGDEIMQRALAAQADLATSQMEASFVATVEGTLFGSPFTVSLDGGKGSVDADWANRKMKAGAELTVTYNDVPFPVKADLYVIDGHLYRAVTISEGTDNWNRSGLPLDVWPILADARRMSGLSNYVESELVEDEVLDGIDCHVLRVTPDLSAIQRAVSEQYPLVGEIRDIESIYDHLSILAWVAKETSLVVKIELSAVTRVTSREFPRLPDGDTLDSSFTLTVEASGFNEPVLIDLPDGARAAP